MLGVVDVDARIVCAMYYSAVVIVADTAAGFVSVLSFKFSSVSLVYE